jgi:hypothetical protein
MGRSPCCEKQHTNKGAWSKEEDDRLIKYIKENGEGCWRSLPKAAGIYTYILLYHHFLIIFLFNPFLNYLIYIIACLLQVWLDVVKVADSDGLITSDLILREETSLLKKMNSSLASTLLLVTSMYNIYIFSQFHFFPL